ncbi:MULTISPECIES: DUF2505 domain-containing protein [unclassified Gordonia (in: high G+C Gram-positive bacteria)]|uniref:DUF2505 domain-containing protein n=1 Tax=unclassified Gordonia (in: high G+C Gram-positive bacteria) TaxID=2657482 RepID=UPI0020001681|nr:MULTISPECIES: DUF2505 domain-containing protein [unclassified Gordonia (in: high G+C Gram-positive bacteria)]UQE74723.1 DUF2505 domain-containing protein [Gordonia sp. PP30]
MARRLSYSARFEFPAEKLHQAQMERQYWQDLVDGFRMLTPVSEIDEFTVGDDGMRVVLKQAIPREMMPQLAQTVVRGDMMITRVETLGSYSAESTPGTYTASIPAGPGSLKGEQVLFDTATGCTLRKTTEVKVFIPFINGKLEQMMLINLVDLFRAEAEYAQSWVAKNLV